jgi:hypothetical protein
MKYGHFLYSCFEGYFGTPRKNLLKDKGAFVLLMEMFAQELELSAPWTDEPIKVPVKFMVGDLDLTYHSPGMQDYIHKGSFSCSNGRGWSLHQPGEATRGQTTFMSSLKKI